MNVTDIAAIRLRSQQLAAVKFRKPEQVVSWMGAMQAQDYNMSKWAVGIRMKGSTVKQIDAALDKGKILRTHLMRPTWHLVAAEDIHWLLELSAPRIKASMRSRNKQLGLTDRLYLKTHGIIEKLVTGHGPLTREQLLDGLRKAKIAVNDNRAAHLLMQAELDGLICSGPAKNNRQTYALLSERVPPPAKYSREEAMSMLAMRYFTGHGPATMHDFSWWAGLSLTDAKKALGMVSDKLSSITAGTERYWFDPSFEEAKNTKNSVFLLPAYDEFIIAYKNRTASLIASHHKKIISSNGIFWPAIITGGKVAGQWKVMKKKSSLVLQLKYFAAQGRPGQVNLREKAAEFGKFLGRPVETEEIR